MVSSPSHPDIEVHIPFSLSLTRGILEGVNQFRTEYPVLTVKIHDTTSNPAQMRQCRAVIVFGRGILLGALGKEVRATVNLSNRTDPPPTHSVLNDDYEVGRMAADHFLDRAFRSFAFAGVGRVHFSLLRYNGFCDRIRNHLDNKNLEIPYFPGVEVMEDFLKLPTPCGILSATDHRAARTVDLAHDAGLRVPEDVAVLGVDDDPVRCAMSRVPLSSVRVDSVAQGYEAMKLAVELLGKRRPPQRLIIRSVPPLGITTRRSTDTFAHSNPEVAAVLRVLHARVQTITGVEALARACGRGTRSLERLFRTHLQSSPREELLLSRFRFARNLLIESSLTINEVAERAGYADTRTLIAHCRRQTDLTPMALRKKFRLR